MWRVSLPVIVWAAHFTAIYSFTALACARQFPAAIPWAIGAATLAALVVLLIVAAPAGLRAMRNAAFADFLTAGLGALALIAIVWEASSLLWVPACG